MVPDTAHCANRMISLLPAHTTPSSAVFTFSLRLDSKNQMYSPAGHIIWVTCDAGQLSAQQSTELPKPAGGVISAPAGLLGNGEATSSSLSRLLWAEQSGEKQAGVTS